MRTRPVPLGAGKIHSRSGISLAEVVIMVAVVAIMTAIAIPQMTGIFSSTTSAVAQKNLNLLNAAVLAFNQANWELVQSTTSGEDDEWLIFRSLRYRDPVHPSPGSPYLPSTTAFHATSDTDTYRAEWNGKMFEMVDIGEAGTGIDLLRMADAPSEMVYEENYQPVGPQP